MLHVHPDDALFESDRPIPVLPGCVHYAGNEKLLAKAFELQRSMGGRFDVVCDLEDGAATGNEREHLHTILKMIPSAFARVGVRVHGPHDTFWHEEIRAICSPDVSKRLAFVTIPKCRSAAQVRAVLDEIRSLEREGGVERQLPVHLLIESPSAVAEVWEMARQPGLEALEFGILDFISEHQGAISESAARSPGQFEHELVNRARTEIAAAAITNGLVPSHNITLDLKNSNQTESDARVARERYGYLRMWSIHPVQIEPILKAMEPDFTGLDDACAILLRAAAEDWKPVAYREKLVDKASYRLYWSLVQRARISGRKLPEAVEREFFG